jgi:hypothetical protein
MAQEALISVISPETKRQKLGPDERPPGNGGPFSFFRPIPASITLAERLDTLENKTLFLLQTPSLVYLLKSFTKNYRQRLPHQRVIRKQYLPE